MVYLPFLETLNGSRFLCSSLALALILACVNLAQPIVDPNKFLFLYGCSVAIITIIAYSYTWTVFKIERHAHSTAHYLRALVARIHGLLELIKMDNSNSSTYLKMLKKEIEDLNNITKNLE